MDQSDQQPKQLEGDIRDSEVRKKLAAMWKAGSSRLNICYLDETLGDWVVKVDGQKVAMGREAKRSLELFNASGDGPPDRSSQN